ncbi:MAG: hypothetical protein ACOC5T_08070 [Elusimicrobiota bacterium]
MDFFSVIIGLFIGAIVTAILIGILNAGAIADCDSKIVYWYRRCREAEKKLKDNN